MWEKSCWQTQTYCGNGLFQKNLQPPSHPMEGTFPPSFSSRFPRLLEPPLPSGFSSSRTPPPPPNPIWISIKLQDTVTGLHILQVSSHLSELLFFSRPGEIILYSNVDWQQYSSNLTMYMNKISSSLLRKNDYERKKEDT